GSPSVGGEFAIGGARECEIADRDHMRAGVAGFRMTAAIAERIELLDIAEPQTRLRLDPGAQADFEGAMARRIERTERQAGKPVTAARSQDQRLMILNSDDRGGQANLDRRQELVAHAALDSVTK